MSAPLIMLLAWAFEGVFGWPNWLYKKIRHPVVWLGALITALERVLNRPSWPHAIRYLAGILTCLISIAVFASAFWLISGTLPASSWGIAVQALLASSLLASRSLYAHVASVSRPLLAGDLDKAREAVSRIVGRDPSQLDEAGIARAALETLAENTSDGIVAPLFWGALLGLPGLAAYKAINTLDSMIGHRNDRYSAFGGFAARLDDVVNFIPARLTGLLIAAASLKLGAAKTMWRDAGKHRSPNAGWPEAAMAGALAVRLSGPRIYGTHKSDEPWLNAPARDPASADLQAGLLLYRRTLLLGGVCLGVIAWGFAG
ncbi:MAG: adenosylcobinamide-phosphate synthase CbiB [Henriciella sp.]